MANRVEVDVTLDKAKAAGNLQRVMVIGRSDSGKVELFIGEADKQDMLVLLARAHQALAMSING